MNLNRKRRKMLEKFFNTDREVFFKVDEEPVVGSWTGTPAKGKRMLRKQDTGEYLSIVGDGYRTVENEEVLMPLQKAMINYFDPAVLESVEIKDTMGYRKGGLITWSEYRFPKLAKPIHTTNGHRTNLMLRYIFKNGYDGKHGMTLYAGEIDTFCTNGMITGSYDKFSKRHTTGFKSDDFVLAFEQSMTKYHEVADQYQRWADTSVSVVNILRTLEKLTGCEEGKSNRLSKKLWAQYLDERDVRGTNLFAFVSALTHYASHDDDRFPITRSGSVDTLYKRQERVQGWLRSKAFRQLEVA